MTYSCTDFVDTILDALGIRVPDEDSDNPSAQADLALAKIERLKKLARQPVSPTEGAVLYVLHISHKHGDSFWTFTSQEEAKKRLVAWASEWWDQDGPGEPKPEDQDDLIQEYFDFAQDESWRIEETSLDHD